METVNNETLFKDTDPDDNNDLQSKVASLTSRLAAHETEKQHMRDEFGLQRAKMKELFLQKEEELKRGSSEHNKLVEEIERLKAELNEARTQVTVTRLDLEARLDEQKQRNQAEITSLQQLVSDTLEESSRYDEEVKRLRRANEQLACEVNDLRCGGGVAGSPFPGARGADSPVNTPPSSGTQGVNPQQLLTVPGAMISTLARKVASQLGAADSVTSSLGGGGGGAVMTSPAGVMTSQPAPPPASGPDSLEESMRKAQEDADVLRSLVIPLEEEISALKDKLRTADQQLRQYQGLRDNDELIHLDSSENSTSQNQTELLSPNKHSESRMRKESSDSSLNRKVCDMCANYENQLVTSQQRSKELEKQLIGLERCREELAKETSIRKDMEQKWNERKEEHKAEVCELQQRAKEAEECVRELKQLFEQVKTAAMDDLSRLSGERHTVQLQLDRLQMENEDLIGKRNANARKLEEEVIDLPNNVEDLQELTLKFREDLIAARVGQEAAEQEVGKLREKLQYEVHNRQASEASYSHDLESLKAKLFKVETDLQEQHRQARDKSLEELRQELTTVRAVKAKQEETISELKSRVSSLQTELKNSEIVQQDFVRLSQSLQTELERIRNSHTELRWEHEDDIEQCPGCHFNFAQNFSTNSRKKVHCLHCGRVFCVVCLSHTVLSGPKQRPNKVCDVCHTLLEQYTAPYFSTEPPHSQNN
ncbi:LOW QUALITY PROTEIN: rab GTPase-binding effector protein 1 [Nilaparvata lugens]|uniref:LOW QUALITY PROTEIN: rab GTPase-binding effector protein 1 n=1 Tax=Nilaparvata lugens TaxID=108931 RepID=UPI00193CB1A7|nr:LOW QUALITY PROTEIN: rab GTPase-binding effector protein 1 [Nilaparvata lugens]